MFYSLLQAWLTIAHVNVKEISLFALIGLPYAWKFVWSPLMDRYIPRFPGWRPGRRRGWMFVTQLLVTLAIASFGFFSPAENIWAIAAVAALVAFFSASQDIVTDAYRRELLADTEQGLGNAVHVNAYKVAGLVPGSLSLILATVLPWKTVFIVAALFMLPGIDALGQGAADSRRAAEESARGDHRAISRVPHALGMEHGAVYSCVHFFTSSATRCGDYARHQVLHRHWLHDAADRRDCEDRRVLDEHRGRDHQRRISGEERHCARAVDFRRAADRCDDLLRVARQNRAVAGGAAHCAVRLRDIWRRDSRLRRSPRSISPARRTRP